MTGPGDLGIDPWKREAFAWLDANPVRHLPVGDALGVLRTVVRLKLAAWDG